MFHKVLTCLSVLGLLFGVMDGSSDLHSHEHAFLGEYATNVLNMEPQELEDLLFWLVEQRIDHNKDMLVNMDELKHWMQHVYHNDLENSIMKAFFDCNKKKDHDITFKEYRSCLALNPNSPEPTVKSENRLVARWRQADSNGDNKLCLTEFGTFFAPDEPHNQLMHGLLVDEYIEDRDLNGDLYLTFKEFISQSVDENDLNSGADWELSLDERFNKIDENQDNLLSHPELEYYLFPPNHEDNASDEEARHIMEETDDNGDGKISHREMMKHLSFFVGSQVLQQGKILLRSRDEL